MRRHRFVLALPALVLLAVTQGHAQRATTLATTAIRPFTATRSCSQPKAISGA